ncbi:MAG: sulfite exporter TauE/SafE family protein, partial [Lachnospiraceae bacterium]|nr:sulfite exporter TauE/SafE family protein [Lachnospiraceae bacterium]
MVFVLVFAICFLASVIGAICGIGGGVIIKPALDAFGIMDVSTISFLSGCTVLSMTTYSVI